MCIRIMKESDAINSYKSFYTGDPESLTPHSMADNRLCNYVPDRIIASRNRRSF